MMGNRNQGRGVAVMRSPNLDTAMGIAVLYMALAHVFVLLDDRRR